MGGGILILLMAISMLQARTSPSKHTEEEATEGGTRDALGVVPLVLTVIVLVIAAAAWLALRAAEPIGRVLGRTGINIFTRLMGLLLAAVAVEFIAAGLIELFPALAGR